MPEYPIVKYPLVFANVLQALPAAPTPPVPLSLPVYPVRSVLTLGRGAWVLLLLLVGGTLLIVDQVWGALTVGLLLVIGWWWAECRGERRHRIALETYHAAFERYVSKDDGQQYEGMLSKYIHQRVPAYYAQYMVPILSATSLPFQPIPSTERQPTVGRSEGAFRKSLEQHFGEQHIWGSCRVPVNEPGIGVEWYYPDFVYCDSFGLCIDIEIDEPYAWASREPTHYLGKDNGRNAFFLRHHWAVVRFSEEQVVRYPHLCCQELAALIFYLTGRSYAARLYQDRLPRTPQWHWVEAQFLAQRRAREEYWVESATIADGA